MNVFKAIQAATSCRRCGRVLTHPVSIERGYGPVCWAKIRTPGSINTKAYRRLSAHQEQLRLSKRVTDPERHFWQSWEESAPLFLANYYRGKNCVCLSCGEHLIQYRMYKHDGGRTVTRDGGGNELYWVYGHCLNCGYETSHRKLDSWIERQERTRIQAAAIRDNDQLAAERHESENTFFLTDWD